MMSIWGGIIFRYCCGSWFEFVGLETVGLGAAGLQLDGHCVVERIPDHEFFGFFHVGHVIGLTEVRPLREFGRGEVKQVLPKQDGGAFA